MRLSARHPMPWIACAGIAAFIAVENLSMAVGLLVLFDCYLRPYELLNIRRQDILLPAASFRHITLVVCPLVSGRPTKAKLYDDGVALDSADRSAVSDILLQWLQQEQFRPTDKLFRFTQQELNAAICRACEFLGLASFAFTAYHGRHGGPSEDRASKLRSEDEVRKRGRWAALSSLKRYEQCNRLHVVLASFPQPLILHLARCAAHLPELVLQPRPLARPVDDDFAAKPPIVASEPSDD